MALTRKFLKALGLEDEKIEEIITAHSDTVTGLKDEIDKYKADAEKLPAVQAELDKAKASGGDSWKVKYDAIKDEFDTYKSESAAKEIAGKKRAALKQILADCKISEKRHEAIMKVTDIEQLELGEDGAFKDADKLSESLKTEWADFIETTTTEPTGTPTPPATVRSTDKEKEAEVIARVRTAMGLPPHETK